MPPGIKRIATRQVPRRLPASVYQSTRSDS